MGKSPNTGIQAVGVTDMRIDGRVVPLLNKDIYVTTHSFGIMQKEIFFAYDLYTQELAGWRKSWARSGISATHSQMPKDPEIVR